MNGKPVPCSFDVVVIGAGPAGLAAAVAARACGAQRVLVLERQSFVGGVLPQCVHDGFGLHIHGAALTGPEYASLWHEKAKAAGVTFCFDTMVMGVERVGASEGDAEREQVPGAALKCCTTQSVISQDAMSNGADGTDVSEGFVVEAVGAALGGRRWLRARSVVAATGCRERTRGQLMIPGTRPAGVMTAGCAQYMMNVKNQLPGDKVVILGTGDVGLIMARRLTLEGADVRLVLGAEPAGLLRNHIRCIKDFDIDLRLGWSVASIHGRGQLKGVTVAPLAPDGSFLMEEKRYVRCNLLLIACGLIPEREVFANVVDGEAGGLTGESGFFNCGNSDVPHDVVDQVTQDGLRAGAKAAAWALGHSQKDAFAALPEELQGMLSVTIVESKAYASVHGVSQEADAEGATCVVCTVCPNGCVVLCAEDGTCSGQGCERGVAFARAEAAHPMRLFTGTVKVADRPRTPLLPVRTDVDVPRAALRAVARACRRIQVSPPVQVGDVVCADVGNTGANLVACANVGEGA